MNSLTYTFGLTQRDIETITTIFARHPTVTRVWVFGSRAKGNYKKGSDIDLAIMNNGVKREEIMKMKAEFEESLIPYFVDLVNYPQLKHLELKDHIERVGKVLYER